MWGMGGLLEKGPWAVPFSRPDRFTPHRGVVSV